MIFFSIRVIYLSRYTRIGPNMRCIGRRDTNVYCLQLATPRRNAAERYETFRFCGAHLLFEGRITERRNTKRKKKLKKYGVNKKKKKWKKRKGKRFRSENTFYVLRLSLDDNDRVRLVLSLFVGQWFPSGTIIFALERRRATTTVL